MAETATGLLESDDSLEIDTVTLVTRYPLIFAQGFGEPAGAPAADNPYGDPVTSDEALAYLLGKVMREEIHFGLLKKS